MTYEMICAGFGGQGVLTAGLILIHAAASQDLFVSWSPSYGSEMRGGTANCNVVLSDEEIGSPYPNRLDILLAMNDPSVGKFQEMVRAGGRIFVNSSIVRQDRIYPKGIQVFEIPATELANSLQNPKGANIVMLGALIRVTELIPKDVFMGEIEKYFAAKGKNNPRNAECFLTGYEQVKEKV